MLAETALIGLHQTHLADCGGSLQFMHGAGTLFPAQALHAFGNGTGGHQHHFAALRAQGGDLLCPICQGIYIQAGALIGDKAAADFDDDAFGTGSEQFSCQWIVDFDLGFLRAFGDRVLLLCWRSG